MATGTVPPGRPRDEKVGAALKSAALRLVRERGYQNVPVAAILKEAGVARQSLYNRWNTKADLVMEAFFEDAGTRVAPPAAGQGRSGRDELERFLNEVFDHLAAEDGTLRSLIAAAQSDPEFCRMFRERFVLPREALAVAFLAEAQRLGELPAGRDPEIMAAFLHGAFWYRLLSGQPLGPELARAIAGGIFGP
ncbi:TetR/AcrR family transcriptional regulator [Mangrovicoccus sp. HB161399]|uniref:TetR/AcrR family transcriptional regulator n=1 Tax=Mangrovicoccus sp. HB161399 TaxID=2720392 RepID=UPI0015551C12|nr:TetR/AcrR family transcriptional regulator [Mangrovicoccus sp. HB161399]